MAEENLIFSGYDVPQLDSKRQNLLECVLTGNSSCLWVRFTLKINLINLATKKWKLFNYYKAKLSGQMVKSLGWSIINMYSMGACAVLGISNQDALSEDLESDPFLNSAHNK